MYLKKIFILVSGICKLLQIPLENIWEYEHKKYSIYSLLYGKTEFYIVPHVCFTLSRMCGFFLTLFWPQVVQQMSGGQAAVKGPGQVPLTILALVVGRNSSHLSTAALCFWLKDRLSTLRVNVFHSFCQANCQTWFSVTRWMLQSSSRALFTR